MKLFLHIGYPKTATTTLQRHFFPQIEEITFLGKYYIDHPERYLFNTRAMFDRVIRGKSFSGRNKIFHEPLNQETLSNKLVISEEDFTYVGLRYNLWDGRFHIPSQRDISKRAREFFGRDDLDIKIIITIRTQDDLITSIYAQGYTFYHSKHQKTNTFEKFLSLFLEEAINHPIVKHLDYHYVINCWAEEFGRENCYILCYEELKEAPENYYRKLCRILGVDEEKYYRIALNKRENVRDAGGYKKVRELDLYQVLRRLKARYLPWLRIGIGGHLRRLLGSVKIKRFDEVSKTIFLTDGQRQMIKEIYHKSNRLLAEEYGLPLERYGYYN